ncbi:unnamed protein product [Heligmosomoides polygyrus]|uniref:HIG1 domain-containing protein n=1 Tax=Heligmosomoides polygyrus TaxID=6339 RepID=A0A183GJ74_HELPZ|nr:unnamed protein product [Heligmosomoides polygyrus]
MYLLLFISEQSFSEMKRDSPTLKEYAEAQRELGSCMDEFREAVTRSTKFGAAIGVPFGLYVAYRHHGVKLQAFASKSIATWLATTMTFGVVGLMAGTYNCLRVKM